MHAASKRGTKIRILCLAALVGYAVHAGAEEPVFPLRPFAETTAGARGESEAGRPTFLLGAEAAARIGSAGVSPEREGLAPKAFLAFSLDGAQLDLVAHLSANTDAKYGPALADLPGGNLANIYFLMEEGGLRWKGGPLALTAGRFRHYDVVDSPYSLFANSRGQSATLMSLAYDDGLFFYESRWIELNRNSRITTEAWGLGGDTGTGFPDRGANLKTYGLRLRNGMRLGFQDAATYALRSFDPEYFLNPIPQYFIQYAQSTGGRPWATEQDDGNMIGAFWDWRQEDGWSFVAQVLMDDFNIGGLGGSVMNPNQVAFNLGGRVETRSGRFALYAAGATKYTFEPAPTQNAGDQAMNAYGYTYYPDTRYDYDRHKPGFQPAALEIEDNAIGYLYGQNNLAFRADWLGRIGEAELSAALEYRLMGDNSPANPWHDLLDNPADGTHWFDDPVLEHRFMAGATAAFRTGPWRLCGELSAGVAFNAIELRAPTATSAPSPVDTKIHLYGPVWGNTKPLFKLTLGAAYEWRL